MYTKIYLRLEPLGLELDVKEKLPSGYLFVGGHSASFVAQELLDHAPGRQGRAIDDSTEEFVDETRMGASV